MAIGAQGGRGALAQFVADIGQDDFRALADEEMGGGGAEAHQFAFDGGRRAGQQRYLVPESHFVLPFDYRSSAGCAILCGGSIAATRSGLNRRSRSEPESAWWRNVRGGWICDDPLSRSGTQIDSRLSPTDPSGVGYSLGECPWYSRGRERTGTLSGKGRNDARSWAIHSWRS
jgi:hypothetical protein